MAGNAVGQLKQAASRTGVTPEEWTRLRADGFVWCSPCKLWKLSDDFCVDKSRKSGRQQKCRSCASTAAASSLYKIAKHNVTNIRKGKCAICERSGIRIEVDHDHATGKVRGGLCSRCNRGLGLFLDNPAMLKKALAYLEKHNGKN